MTTNSAFAERLGLIVGVSLVAMMAFTTVAPFYVAIPQASVRLIDQQQTILQSVFLVLVGYLWGNSAGNKAKDSAVEKLAATNAALAPPPPGPSLEIAPGESATVKAGES